MGHADWIVSVNQHVSQGQVLGKENGDVATGFMADGIWIPCGWGDDCGSHLHLNIEYMGVDQDLYSMFGLDPNQALHHAQMWAMQHYGIGPGQAERYIHESKDSWYGYQELESAESEPKPTSASTPVPTSVAAQESEPTPLPESKKSSQIPEAMNWMDPSSAYNGWSREAGYGYGIRYGQWGNEPRHTGWDIPLNVGSQVQAMGDGEVVVVAQGWATYPGWTVGIYHGMNPDDGTGFWTYAMEMRSAAVSVGQYVKAGDLIGYSGHNGLYLHVGASNQPPIDFLSNWYQHADESADGTGWVSPRYKPDELIKVPYDPSKKGSTGNDHFSQNPELKNIIPSGFIDLRGLDEGLTTFIDLLVDLLTAPSLPSPIPDSDPEMHEFCLSCQGDNRNQLNILLVFAGYGMQDENPEAIKAKANKDFEGYWEIPANAEDVSMDDTLGWGGWEALQGMVQAPGAEITAENPEGLDWGNGLCNAGCFINQTLSTAGLLTDPDDQEHASVHGCEDKYLTRLYIYDDGSKKDLTITNPYDHPVRLHWQRTGDKLTLWVESVGQGAFARWTEGIKAKYDQAQAAYKMAAFLAEVDWSRIWAITLAMAGFVGIVLLWTKVFGLKFRTLVLFAGIAALLYAWATPKNETWLETPIPGAEVVDHYGDPRLNPEGSTEVGYQVSVDTSVYAVASCREFTPSNSLFKDSHTVWCEVGNGLYLRYSGLAEITAKPGEWLSKNEELGIASPDQMIRLGVASIHPDEFKTQDQRGKGWIDPEEYLGVETMSGKRQEEQLWITVGWSLIAIALWLKIWPGTKLYKTAKRLGQSMPYPWNTWTIYFTEIMALVFGLALVIGILADSPYLKSLGGVPSGFIAIYLVGLWRYRRCAMRTGKMPLPHLAWVMGYLLSFTFLSIWVGGVIIGGIANPRITYARNSDFSLSDLPKVVLPPLPEGDRPERGDFATFDVDEDLNPSRITYAGPYGPLVDGGWATLGQIGADVDAAIEYAEAYAAEIDGVNGSPGVYPVVNVVLRYTPTSRMNTLIEGCRGRCIVMIDLDPNPSSVMTGIEAWAGEGPHVWFDVDLEHRKATTSAKEFNEYAEAYFEIRRQKGFFAPGVLAFYDFRSSPWLTPPSEVQWTYPEGIVLPIYDGHCSGAPCQSVKWSMTTSTLSSYIDAGAPAIGVMEFLKRWGCGSQYGDCGFTIKEYYEAFKPLLFMSQ
ncbi:M23 family metallopeptidase [Patescibacteria group bacterium]|nr:M23 family metallopeptidase [Patescibacteria group bacterium]MBU1885349.1 M23 family metallopeptidase [Patescibacteria group bacterium]